MSSRARSTGSLFGLTVLVALGLTSLQWSASRDADHASVVPSPSANEFGPAQAATSVTDVTAIEPPDPGHRAPIGSPEVVSKSFGKSFEERVDELVELGVAIRHAVDDDDDDRAVELDDECRTALVSMQRDIDRADERALHALCGLPEDDVTFRTKVRRGVLLTVLEFGLRHRWESVGYGASRAASDSLVESILISLPQNAVLARELGIDLLADEPFLGPIHEQQVLTIVDDAGAEESFLGPVAEALLRTLWRNLAATDARSSQQLASLALVFFEDANPARRLAALRHLLSAEDGRYRQFVIDHVAKSKDRELVRALATTAARELEPPAAVAALGQLAGVDRHANLTAAFMLLGTRGRAAMEAEYERRLGDGNSNRFRAELVTGAGFQDGGTQLAMTAFDHDPDPLVRERALLVIASQAEHGYAERAVDRALDDPAFGEDAQRLGAIVSALQNLGDQGAVHAVARIGERLRVHPRLDAAQRARLEEILTRYSPSSRR